MPGEFPEQHFARHAGEQFFEWFDRHGHELRGGDELPGAVDDTNCGECRFKGGELL